MPDVVYAYNNKLISPSAGKVLGATAPAPSVTYNIELSWDYFVEPPAGARAYFQSNSITADLTMYYRDAVGSWVELTSAQKAALLNTSTRLQENIYGLRITGIPSLSNWMFDYADMYGYEIDEGYARVTDSNSNVIAQEEIYGYAGTWLSCTYNGTSEYGILEWSCDGALAPRSMRFDFKYDHFNPTTLVDYGGLGATWTHVEDDVYDFYYNSTDWGARNWSHLGTKRNLFYAYSSSVSDQPFTTHNFDVIDANLEDVTDVEQLLGGLGMGGLKSIESIRNTSSVTNFNSFLYRGRVAAQFTSIPLFDTSSAEDVRNMCNNARNVTTGALALYTQMSTQANPPTSYSGCFSNCGSGNASGQAELAQIPTSWGGTMA